MAISVLDREIEEVAVIDDQPNVRDSFSEYVEDANLTPVLVDDTLQALGDTVQWLKTVAQAALCDFQLRLSQYAQFDGAELVAALYNASVPAVLCTRFEKANIDDIRRYRPNIPCLLNPNQLNEDSLIKGFELCVREFKNDFTQERRSWRTLVRIQGVEAHHVYLFVPAWSSRDALRLLRTDVPPQIEMRLKEGLRCHARVNLGATRQEDVYFTDWEA